MKWIKVDKELVSLQDVFRIEAMKKNVHLFSKEGTIMHTFPCADPEAADEIFNLISDFIISPDVIIEIE